MQEWTDSRMPPSFFQLSTWDGDLQTVRALLVCPRGKKAELKLLDGLQTGDGRASNKLLILAKRRSVLTQSVGTRQYEWLF